MNKEVDIAIIGAGLTGLTLAYYLKKAGKNVVVIEKSNKVGGVIQTIEKDGFVFETGPNTGVLGNAETVELFEDLSKYCTLEIANPQANNRWIWKDNKWHSLPSNPISFFKSPLFTTKDKIKLLGEPRRKPGTNPNETLAEMVIRRLGQSFLDYAVNPFISGIYAGDPEKLITKYALPKLYNLEQQYGSFIKGAFKKKKEAKTESEKKANRKVMSAEGGLHQLIKALEKEIGQDNIILNAKAHVDTNENGGFIVEIENSSEAKTIKANNVVSTFGGYSLSDVFSFLPVGKLNAITNTNYAKVTQVIVGYKSWKGRNLNAFGGLIPSKEKRDILGVLFTGSLFKGRKPAEGALLSVFMGGVKRPDIYDMSDEEIRELVKKEINITLNSKQEPELFEIFRYKHAIPQYEITSKERFEAIDAIEQSYKGLVLAGNIRNGIGMADRIKQARDIAASIINE